MKEEFKPHKTEEVLIGDNVVKIDELMVPFIKYLNGLKSVNTLYCCEGDDDLYEFLTYNTENKKYELRDIPVKPYVLFTCDNSSSLMTILKLTEKFTEEVYVQSYPGLDLPRYRIEFESKKKFLECLDKMGD